MDDKPRATPIETFRALRDFSDMALMQAAMQVGLEGDVPSMTNLVQALLEGAVPVTIAQGGKPSVVVCTYSGEPDHEPGGTVVEGASFEEAVTRCLVRHAQGLSGRLQPADVLPIAKAQERLMRAFRLEPLPWGEDHEELLAMTARLLGGLDAQRSQQRLLSLLDHVASRVNHVRPVEIVLQAGLSEHDLYGTDVFRRDTIHPVKPLLLGGNFLGAARVVEQAGSEAARRQLDRLVEQMSTTTVDSPWMHMAMVLAQETRDHAGAEGIGPRAMQAMAFFDSVQMRVDDDTALRMRAEMLGYYLRQCDHLSQEKDMPPDRALVQALLDAAPAGRTTLREHLQREDAWRRDYLGSRPLHEDFAVHLTTTACELHVCEVVEAALPLIKLVGLVGHPNEMLRHVSSQDQRKGRQRIADLVGCLQLLQDIGLPVREDFEIAARDDAQRMVRNTVLHMMAKGQHRDQLSAMVAAMELGCNPKQRNHAGRMPGALIANADVREQWETAVRSFMAAQAAQAALWEKEVVKKPLRCPGCESSPEGMCRWHYRKSGPKTDGKPPLKLV